MVPKKIYNLLIILLITTYTTQNCSTGCLQCNTQNECQFCDFTKGYHLTEKSCALKSTDNCIFYNNQANCLTCAENYYLDTTKCVEVLEENKILNCRFYSNIYTCSICEKNFFIKDNRCTTVQNVINNCEVNGGSDFCEKCEDGFLLDFMKQKCVKIESKTNCKAYSNIECFGCKSSSMEYKNYLPEYYEKYLISGSSKEKILEKENLQTVLFNDKCQAITITNCKVFQDYKTCKLCKEGYYLKNNKCLINPVDLIENCLNYFNSKSCRECLPNFYLKTETNCHPVLKIENCKNYSSTQNTTICLQCEDSYFLKDKNICIERINRVKECNKFFLTQDICEECKPAYHLIKQKTKCILKIKDCLEYLPIDAENDEIKCLQCENGFFFKDGICEKGTIENCLIYNRIEDICLNCLNGFYLEFNVCKKHIEIDLCENYDKSKKNKCNYCSNDSILFKKLTKCTAVEIEGCELYRNKTQCLKCKNGFMLKDTYLCETIDESLNCLRGEFGFCSECKIGYFLNKGICEIPFEFLTENCEENNFDGIKGMENGVCLKCKENSVSLNYKGSYLCVKRDKLARLSSQVLDSNCKGYLLDENTGTYQCGICKENYFAVENSNCVLGCSNKSVYFAKLQRENNKVNISGFNFCHDLEDNCLNFGPHLVQSNINGEVSYGCTKCAANFIKEIDFDEENSENSTLVKNPTHLYSDAEDKIYSVANFKCTSSNVLTDFFMNNLLVANCQYYAKMPDGRLGCTKCNHKLSGVTETFKIDHCKIYNEEKKICEKCITGKTLSNNNLKCENETGPTNCLPNHFINNKCYKCKDNFSLNSLGTTCTAKIIIPSCEIQNAYSQNCEKCSSTHHLNTLKTACILNQTNCIEHSSTGNCIKCKNGFILNTSTTKTSCKPGYKLVTDSCLNSDIPGNCTSCNATFSINTSTPLKTCSKETTYPECWIFDQTTSKCLTFKKKLPFVTIGICEPITKVTNCILYSNKTDCIKCADTHYLASPTCCHLLGQYGDNCSSPKTLPANNCSIIEKSGSDFKCKSCPENYHMDKNHTTDRIIDQTGNNHNYKCVPLSSYWNGTEKKTIIELKDNTINCDVYNNLLYKCAHCDTGYYLSNDKCCLLETVNVNGNCVSIYTTYSHIQNFCTKVDNSNLNDVFCYGCKDDGVIEKYLVNKTCCSTTQYYDDGCVDNPNNCKVFDKVSKLCTECVDGAYKTAEFNNCCLESEVSNGVDSCVTMVGDGNKTHCLQFDNPSSICTKCKDNYTWDLTTKNCRLITSIYKNCNQINSTTKKCSKCKTGYYLTNDICCLQSSEYYDPLTANCKAATTSIPNCLNHSTNTTCSQCSPNYYLTNTNQTCCLKSTFFHIDTCISITNLITNCSYFNYTEKRCLTCTGSNNTNYYILNTGTRCCEYGQYENDSGNCVTIDNKIGCAMVDDKSASNCVSCFDGFFGSSTCTAMIDNCVVKGGSVGECFECEVGFVLSDDRTACEAVDFESGVQNESGFYNCKKESGTSDECEVCRDFYYLSKDFESGKSACCPFGFFYRELQGCLEFGDEFCAVVDHQDCDMCFLNKDYCSVNELQVYRIKNGNFGLNVSLSFSYSDVTLDYNYYEEYYSAGENCCPVFKFWNSTKDICEEIPLKNCLKYNGSECFLCNSEYILNQGICCKYNETYDHFSQNCVSNPSITACTNDDYLTNSHCCKKKTYWDTEKNRCMPLFDPNCEKSENSNTCIECKTGYTYDTKYPSILELELNNKNCKNPSLRSEIHLCIINSEIISSDSNNQIESYNEMTYTTTNCLNFNFTTKTCDECIEGSYKTATYKNCCTENETGILIDGSFQCLKISLLLQNCFNYDSVNRKCLKCKTNYHLSGGRCCSYGTFLNKNTMECTIDDQPRCKVFELDSLNCLECEEDSYFSDDHCCRFKRYWGSEPETPSDKKCLYFSHLGLQNCDFVNKNGECGQCNSNQYIHKGFCCFENMFWKKNNCYNIHSILGENNLNKGFKNCLRLDDTNNCKKCNTGSYLTSGRCCLNGEFWNTSNLLCESGSITDCNEYNNDANICLKCITSKNLINNKGCCPDGEFWNIDSIISSPSACHSPHRNENCLIVDSSFNCLKCKPLYISLTATNSSQAKCVLRSSVTANADCLRINAAEKCVSCIDSENKYIMGNVCVNKPTDCKTIATDSTTCTACKTLTLLGDSKTCVNKWNDCSKTNSDNTKCIACKNGYKYNNNYTCGTLSGSIYNNCLLGDYDWDGNNNDRCVSCEPGYSLGSDRCSFIQRAFFIPHCQIVDSTTTCAVCDNDYHVDNGICCLDGEFAMSFSGVYNCVSIDYFDLSNCDAFDLEYDEFNLPINVKCEKCESEFYVSNGGCCDDSTGKFWNGSTCVDITITSLADCKQYNSNTECKQINDLTTPAERVDNCTTGYFINNHCCPENKYWDIKQNNCVNISIPAFIGSCAQVNENGECIKCQGAEYLSNKNCCDDLKYFDGSICSLISTITAAATDYTGCKQISDNKCLECDSTTTPAHTLVDGCCSDGASKKSFFHKNLKKCKAYPPGCTVIDISTLKCTGCAGPKYATPLGCCSLTEYYDISDNSCKTIPNQATSLCQKMFDEDITDSICSECTGATDVVRDNKCCAIDEIKIGTNCVKSSLITNCVKVNDDGYCDKCKLGHNLTGGIDLGGGKEGQICCPVGQFYNETTFLCAAKTITSCEIQKTTTKCSKCLTTHFLTNSDQNCCPIGKNYVGSSCNSTITVKNCTSFTGTTCTECSSTYNIYKDTTNMPNGICCSDGYYYNIKTDITKCIPIPKLTEDCKNFDYTTGHCESCVSTKYISDKICCLYNKKWDTASLSCIDFTESKCNGYSDLEGNCVSCSDGNYLTGDKCCVFGEGVVSSGGSCVSVSGTPKFCKKFSDGVCEECLDGHVFYGSTCCPHGQYLDGTCKTQSDLRLNNCKVFDVSNLADLKCKDCKDDYFLVLDGKACCKTDNFVDGTNCYEVINFFDGCEIYDQSEIKCLTCQTGYYITNGLCCQNNKYLDTTDLTCKPIDQVLYQNCSQFLLKKNECLSCKENYKLKHSTKTCQQSITNCLTYDAEINICTSCITNYYLTNGLCCNTGEYNKNGTCATIPLKYSGCEKFEDNICKKCESTHYLIDGFCCMKGYYKTGDFSCELVGSFENCEEFGSQVNYCTKCVSGFVLLKVGLDQRFCLEVSGRNCDQFSVSEDNEVNKLMCEECLQENVEFVKKEMLANDVEEFLDFDKGVENCINYDLRNDLKESSLVCMECDATRFAYNDFCFLRQKIENCEVNDILDKDYCNKCDTGFFLHQNGTCLPNPQNCEVYDKSRDLCIKCNSTHLLYYSEKNSRKTSECILLDSTESAAPTFFPSYIKTCSSTIPSCETKIYKNLSGTLEKLFSCHKCTSPKIPITTYSGGKTTTNYPLNIKTLKTTSNPTNASTLCLNPITTSFNSPSSFEFPLNCALGLYNGDKEINTFGNSTENPDLQKMSLFCVACKPGYRPLRNSRFSLHVYNCVFIDFCDSKGNLDRCDECESGYSFGFGDGVVDFGKCVVNSDLNCWVRDESGNECVYCKKGYVLNYDKICVRYQAPFCNDAFFYGLPFFGGEDLESVLDMMEEGNGCVSCESGFVGLYQFNDNFVCTESDYISNRVFTSSSDFYDTNCLKYGFSEESKIPTCKECKENYIIDENKKCLTKIPALKNCEIAKNSLACSKCKLSFIITNNTCLEPSIENCETYSTNNTNISQTCLSCSPKHYLKKNKCLPGTTKNCLLYNDSNICLKCDNNFSLVTIQNQKKLCYPVTKHQNCINYSNISFQHNLLKCSKCETNEFIIENITEEYVCNSFVKIDNCLLYDKSDMIINSSFKCLKCEENFYLKDNKCFERSVFVKDCKVYSERDVECLYCEDMMYLSKDKSECLTNPQGIPFCYRYLSPDKCLLCAEKFFLKDNKCLEVPEINLVDNCGFYVNDEECESCIGGMVLFKNRCENPIAQKCDRFLTPKECESCVAGYGIQIIDGLRKCVTVEKRLNCEQQDGVFPFGCVICEIGFFVSNLDCGKSEEIENCVFYEGNGICGKCEEKFVLSFDKKNCVENGFFSECEDFRIIGPFCVLCEDGYFIDYKGDCVNDLGFKKIFGCLVVDKESGLCGMCETGFFMNDKMECVSVDRGDIGGVEDDVDKQEEFGGVYSFFWVSLFFYVYFS